MRPSTLTRSPRAVILTLIVLLLVLGLIGLGVQHWPSTSATTTVRPTEKAASVQKVIPQEYSNKITQPTTSFDLKVQDEKLASGPKTITVKQGDAVRINIATAGEEVKVHLHGYEIITESNSADNAPGGFSFVADTKGTFPYYAVEEQAPIDMSEPHESLLGYIVVE